MERFSHIAGDVGLDLINTVEWRLSPESREEDLASYDDVVAWCVESGLLAGSEASQLAAGAQEGKRELQRVVALREALYQALFEDEEPATSLLTQELHEAVVAADYEPREGGWAWRDRSLSPATPRHRVARAIMALLSRRDLDRLHQCEDAHCGWVFLDTSRAHNRRWCVTKDCGDRNRSRAYYQRQKAKR